LKPVRVLQFITPSGFYGAERWILALANNSDPTRVIHDLAVTREGSGQGLKIVELYPPQAGNVHTVPTKGRFDPGVVKKLVRIIREQDIDVIHTHGYKSDILGFLAARIAGIKCVSTPHGFSGNVGWKLGLFIRLGTRFFRHFDAVAPLSEELMADMRRFGVRDDRLQLILNGVDLKEIRSTVEAAASPSAVEDAEPIRRIGFVGQLIPRKAVGDLIEVFDDLYEQDNRLRLEIVGDGRQRAELEAVASGKPCSNAVRFLGFRDDRLSLMSRFDLFVMTSSLEGIPRCMMEAMALKVPVVAYSIPGVSELVEHDRTGLLAVHGNKDELKSHCRFLLENPTESERLAEAARQKIQALYSANRMATEYENLFRQLLSRDAESSERQASQESAHSGGPTRLSQNRGRK
jgi:glycosyltransferase involved in cell wall biosynthesis